MKREECYHGSLRRSCDRCDMEQDVRAAEGALEVADMRADRYAERLDTLEALLREVYTCPEVHFEGAAADELRDRIGALVGSDKIG